jgi:hypothetical protein
MKMKMTKLKPNEKAYDYDIDINLPVTVRFDNGNVIDLKLDSDVVEDDTLISIFRDIDKFLEKEFESGTN